jgi:hypothetical protein
VLQSVRSTGLQSVIAGDESRFFLYYPRDSIWASSRDEVPERVSHKINTEKCLVSFLWSVNGIHSFVDIPKGSIYNSAFFCDTVVPSLLERLLFIPEENHSKINTSTRTMHFRIMPGGPLNIFTQNDSTNAAPGSHPRPRQFIRSHLIIATVQRPGRTSL